MSEAIGLLETRGYVGLVEASDAMIKAANVQLIKSIPIGGALVTTIVQGDVAASKRPSKPDAKRRPASAISWPPTSSPARPWNC